MKKQLKGPKVVNRIATAPYGPVESERRSFPGYSMEELDARAKTVTEVLKKFLQFPLPLPK